MNINHWMASLLYGNIMFFHFLFTDFLCPIRLRNNSIRVGLLWDTYGDKNKRVLRIDGLCFRLKLSDLIKYYAFYPDQ